MSRLFFPKQFVRGYVKIFREARHLIVRDETAALLNPQDGQVAALHAKQLEPASEGSLGKPMFCAELLYLRTDDVFGSTVPVDFINNFPSKDEVRKKQGRDIQGKGEYWNVRKIWQRRFLQ